MNYKAVLFSLLAFFGTSSAQADEASAAALTKVLSGINSMQADFAQQTSDAKGRPQPVQSGRLAVKRPGQFRWEVQKPSAQMVLTSGKVMWIYDPELMQATKQKLDEQVGNTPALLLSGDPRKLNEAFVIAQEAGSAGEQAFLLKPHGKEALFDSLRVRFKGNQLVQMVLVDALGQKTDIRFSNVQVNPALAAAQFEFTPPKGVDVIDQL
ncbi:MAG: outer membrane lipoprotein chaperone LolA [Moraxellaceae bacterium]